jgi:hypothetical protein
MRRPPGAPAASYAGVASYAVGFAGAPFVANAATALSLHLFPALVYLFCRPQRARGKFLFTIWLRPPTAEPAPRLRRAAAHARAALALVGDVDDDGEVLRLALSDLGWSSRVRGER